MNDNPARKPTRPRIPQEFRRFNYDPPPAVRPPPPPPPPPPAKWFIQRASGGNEAAELGGGFPHLMPPYKVAVAEALRVPDDLEKQGRLEGWGLLSHEHVYRGALCAIAVVQAKAEDRENAAGNLDRARHVAHKYAEISGFSGVSISGVRALCGVAVAVKNSGFSPESDFQAARRKAGEIKPPIFLASDAAQAAAEIFAYQGDADRAREKAQEEIWDSNGDNTMLSRKDLAIAFSEAGHFDAALEEANKIVDERHLCGVWGRHRCGVWDTIAAGQAEAGRVAEAEKTVANISGKWFSRMERRFHEAQSGVQPNSVIGAWSDRLESALNTAWFLERAKSDPSDFRRFINGVGGIWSPLCRARAWVAFAKHLVLVQDVERDE